jgi:hypothetical protein
MKMVHRRESEPITFENQVVHLKAEKKKLKKKLNLGLVMKRNLIRVIPYYYIDFIRDGQR